MSTHSESWKVIGPGAGGGVFIPTISPFDNNLIFSKGDMTGAFVTYDGGENWRMFNLMTLTTDFEFDPSDPNTVYAANRGYLYDEDRGSGLSLLYRSENRGQSWRVVYPDIKGIENLERLQSMQTVPSELLGPGTPDGSIDIIRVDPSDSRRIFLGLSPLKPYIGKLPEKTEKTAMLVWSVDRGESWTLLAGFPGTKVLGIFPSSMFGKKGEVTVITDEACVRIDERTGEKVRLLLPGKEIVTAEGGTGPGGTVVYIIAKVQRDKSGSFSGGVYRSADGGENWTKVNGHLLDDVPARLVPRFVTLDVCETRPEVVYLSDYTRASGPERMTQTRYETYKTENSGETWKVVYSANSEEVLTDNFGESWLNRGYGPGWGGPVLTLGVAPSDPDICFATDYGRAYRTLDGGITWKQVCSHNHPDGSVSSSGVDITCCYGVSFDPFEKNHLVVSYIDIGLFHSYDGGETWHHLVEGIPRNWVNTCYSLAFDPEVKGRVWSAWANKHSLPRASQFYDGDFERFTGGVAVSDDGGRTWRKSNAGLPEKSICTNLLIDPDSPKEARTMYVGIFDKGVYKSIDGGSNWIEACSGLGDNRYIWQIRLAGEKLFLLSVRGWKLADVVKDGALYTSDDRAASWKAAPLPQGVNAPSDLLVDPEDPRRMYLSCWPRQVNGQDICGGVFLTGDGGQTWEQVFDERMRVFAAAFDPRSSHTVFINTFQNAAFRSDDRGKTWNRLEGYRFKWGHCPVPDPRNPDMLFLTTYGGSVYYGPARGTAGEFGRIENIPESWW
ncbi:MAG: hypothetical protein U9P14_06585 [Gemmatimonadota bacterium]|nr:hypothetical protein [Gemmatimonadota bacterium]